MRYAFAMVIRGLLLITALAPVVGINLAYWIGVAHDNLPSCIPYIDGCTSISSTGRYPPGDRLFRAIMLPQAVLLGVTWYATSLWLRVVRPEAGRAATTALVAGLLGALALIVYVSYLASNDPFYEIMRSYGIYLYFNRHGDRADRSVAGPGAISAAKRDAHHHDHAVRARALQLHPERAHQRSQQH